MADWEKNLGQLLAENYDLRRMVSQKEAELNATEAYHTTMAQALANANAQLAHMSKKEALRVKKIKAKREQERLNAVKEAQKRADHRARQSRTIQNQNTDLIFGHPFSTFKRKDESIVLAGGLELDTTGTVPILKQRIKAYLRSHEDELMQNPRFSGLFTAEQQDAFEIKMLLREQNRGVDLYELMDIDDLNSHFHT